MSSFSSGELLFLILQLKRGKEPEGKYTFSILPLLLLLARDVVETKKKKKKKDSKGMKEINGGSGFLRLLSTVTYEEAFNFGSP